jgi:hypothetical protein
VVSAVVPILTTTLRAVRIASRWALTAVLLRTSLTSSRGAAARGDLRSAAPTRSLRSRRMSVPRPVM